MKLALQIMSQRAKDFKLISRMEFFSDVIIALKIVRSTTGSGACAHCYPAKRQDEINKSVFDECTYAYY